jgi:alpha-L-rhamnosidase
VGNAPLAPTDLNIADRARPLNVEGTPLFGWVPNDKDGNEIQSAYQIQLTRVSDGVLIWDSGKVASSAESCVP